jgi:hypothetical protein
MAGLRSVLGGMFCASRASVPTHFFQIPNATQARDRSEGGLAPQGRLPQEMRLRGVATQQDANRFLREHYIAGYWNWRFFLKPGITLVG